MTHDTLNTINNNFTTTTKKFQMSEWLCSSVVFHLREH